MKDENGGLLNQFLTFMLGEEVFALDIASVREVLEITDITKVPRMPDFMQGVINLRGHAVPVVDMRIKFGMAEGERTVDTCIIITEVDTGEEATLMGALVDSVREVLELPGETLESPPKMGLAVDSSFIKGMGKQNDSFVMILDIDRILSARDLEAIAPMDKSAGMDNAA